MYICIYSISVIIFSQSPDPSSSIELSIVVVMRAANKRIAAANADSGLQVRNGNGNAAAKRARRNPQVMPADSMDDMVQAGKEYRKDLLTRFYKVKMGAEDVCVSAYHHTRSGGLGAADIALKPSSSLRHIRKVLAFNKDKPLQAFIYVPQWNAAKACREIRPLEIRWPHESISHDFERRPHLYDMIMIDPSDYEIPSYTEHQIRMKQGPSTLPVGYYSDKVALGKNDSFLSWVWWVHICERAQNVLDYQEQRYLQMWLWRCMYQ